MHQALNTLNAETIFYKIQSFFGQDDTGYKALSYIYAINMSDGGIQKYMILDGFSLPQYFYPPLDTITGIFYAINFFKVLPDHKLFVSNLTYNKCDSNTFNSYLAILVSINTSVKNSQLTNLSLKIFPNPNNGIFTISFEDKNTSNLQSEMMDVSGTIIYRESKVHEFKSQFTIHATHLAKGIYWIKLTDENTNFSSPIIIQ